MLTTVTLLGLLVATAGAFAITEHLKLIRSPIYATKVAKVVSPRCQCATAKATIAFRLRRSDRISVTILDGARNVVATVATDEQRPKGEVRFAWNGRTDSGAVAPDGVYRPEVRLANARRTILLPNEILVDTTVPKVLSVSDGRGVLVPGAGQLTVRYVFSKDAHAYLYVDGVLVVRGRPTRTHGAVKWGGKLPGGGPVGIGRHAVEVVAVDIAGNRTPAAGARQVAVVVRSVELVPALLHVRAGARFAVDVHTAASRYVWRLAGRHGSGHGKKLRLRAPAQRGRYRLTVSEHGHAANAIVIVGHS